MLSVVDVYCVVRTMRDCVIVSVICSRLAHTGYYHDTE